MSAALDLSFRYEEFTGGSAMEVPHPKNVTTEDARLVGLARAGDFAAFEQLVRTYRNDVYAMAFHFVRNREEAWDISQEVFIKAHRALARFRGDSTFKTWLMRITANQCKDVLKKRRLDAVPYNDALDTHDAPSQVLGPRHTLEASELGDAIEKALDALPHKHRTAFILREYEGLSYEEMAQAMGCTIGTVMSRLHHARRKLQNSLQKMGFSRG
ncbi:MAG: hypothetical protein AMXMBFR4_27560 [Candidatus Hydrogenedentota bacterium]